MKEESNSIRNQRKLIDEYILHQESLRGIETVYYKDDGYSGTTFERPGFKSMIDEIRKRTIDCVIVKDLSRLGRDYIEMGYYLDEVFPLLGVRFIAINDFYDTAEKNGTTMDLSIGFKNIVNDFYCKDTAKKIRATIKIKQDNGEYLGGPLTFGYRKEKDAMVLEQPASDIVKRIFYAYNNGKSAAEIAKKLNAEGIESPSFYMEKEGIRRPSVKNASIQWNGSTVLRILRNEVYTGVLLYRRTESIDSTAKIIKKYEKNEWLHIEGKIPQIISKEEFELASSKKRKRSKKESLHQCPKKYVGIIKCGCCNHNLTWRMGKKGQEIYYCRHFNFTQHDCDYVKITEEDIDGIVKNAFKIQVAMAIDLSKVMEYVMQIYQKKANEVERNLQDARRNSKKCKEKFQTLYHTYVSQNIDKKVFQEKRNQIEKLKKMYENQEKELCERKEEIVKKWGNIREKKINSEICSVEKITKEEMGLLVKEIIYFDEQNIEIIWNFKEAYRELLMK